MAQKVNIILVDDVDGEQADETVRFGLDGTSYEIDLSAARAGELREALAPYIGHARKAGRGAGRGPRSGRGSRARGSSRSDGGAASAAEVRTWARENGWDVPERGRVAAEVREAYAAAH